MPSKSAVISSIMTNKVLARQILENGKPKPNSKKGILVQCELVHNNPYIEQHGEGYFVPSITLKELQSCLA